MFANGKNNSIHQYRLNLKLLAIIVVSAWIFSAPAFVSQTANRSISTIRQDTSIEVKGRFVDSFRNECSRYADCVCAEYAKFLVLTDRGPIKLTNDTIGLFVLCVDDRIKIAKDSIYLITATTERRERVLIVGHDTKSKLREFWAVRISMER